MHYLRIEHNTSEQNEFPYSSQIFFIIYIVILTKQVTFIKLWSH